MIRIENLRMSYRKNEALKGVTFELNPGITGLLGPNGAGKTTLLRCMLGIIRPGGGEVVFPPGMRMLHREAGYLPQKYGLFKELTVQEALEYFGVLKDIPRAEIGCEIDECLHKVNLLESKRSRVGTLSGGMMRRVGIAAALLGKPSLLVFDEPTAGLDPEERVRFKRLAASLAKEHTVLISTHIVEDIEALASQVVILDQGMVCSSGTLAETTALAEGRCFLAPDSLVDEGSDGYYVARFVEVDGRPLARVLACTAPDGFTPTTPTLEDGYLCATKGIA